eukprot:4466631-Pyramimonas_sp.AAC.1
MERDEFVCIGSPTMNTDWLDRRAEKLPKQHSDQLATVDTDKGLGDVVILRSSLNELVHAQFQ